MSTDGIEEVRTQIERDREQLARTVDELSDRLDVKARTQRRVHELRDAGAARASQAQEALTKDDGTPTAQAWTVAGAVVAAAAVVTAVVLVRRNHSR